MKANMGRAHRLLYLVTGVALVGLPFVMTLGSTSRYLFPAIGLLSIFSAATGR